MDTANEHTDDAKNDEKNKKPFENPPQMVFCDDRNTVLKTVRLGTRTKAKQR